MHFFVADLFSIAIITKTYANLVRNQCPMNQWHNEGVAAASIDRGPIGRGPRQREKRPEGAPTWESDGEPVWLHYATAMNWLIYYAHSK